MKLTLILLVSFLVIIGCGNNDMAANPTAAEPTLEEKYAMLSEEPGFLNMPQQFTLRHNASVIGEDGPLVEFYDANMDVATPEAFIRLYRNGETQEITMNLQNKRFVVFQDYTIALQALHKDENAGEPTITIIITQGL